MTDNAKELILAKVNAGNKLAKMYLFLITLGVNINDIVSFMTSPVASFIDTITEENVFDGISIDLNTAINFAKGNFMYNGEINKKYINKYGALKMLQILNLYQKLGLNNADTMADTIADCNEFANVLEGANEFSNFGRLLGLNQGLPTSKIDLLKKISFILKILTQRLDKNSSVLDNVKKEVSESVPLNVGKWLKDENYRKFIAEQYDKVKKCINIFDAFTHIELFDAIRELFSTVIDIDNNLSFKSKAFNSIITEANKYYKYISEKYQNNILREIDKVVIDNFIKNLNISIPVTSGVTYLQSDGAKNIIKENGMFYLDNRASIASFKYIFENMIIPKLKKGIITTVDKDGNVIDKKYTDLLTNPFISALIRTNELKIPFYKVNLNMMTIKDSTDSQRKYQMYSNGLQALSNYKMGDLALSDLFMLYNLIVNKNLYGASRLTTLFDSFISRNLSMRLLSKYFDYLGNLDYFGIPKLSTDLEFDSSKYSKDTPIIDLNFKDIMVSSAPEVRYKTGLSDPFIVYMSESGPIIMENEGGNNYAEVLQFLNKNNNESQDEYLERVYNERSYFVLGGEFSDQLQNKLNILQDLKDNDKIISYINNFIRDGLLNVSKVCK